MKNRVFSETEQVTSSWERILAAAPFDILLLKPRDDRNAPVTVYPNLYLCRPNGEKRNSATHATLRGEPSKEGVYCITGLRYKQRDKVFSPEEKTQSVDFEFANPRSYDGRHGEATLEAGKDRGRFQDWAPIPDCNRILTSWTVQNHGQRIAERQIGVYLDLPKPFEVIKASWKHATEQEGYNPDTSLPGYLYLQSILPCRPETKFAY